MENSETQITTIDEYIAAAPEEVRERLQTLRETIREAAPDADEIISYAMPTFWQNGNLVYFSAAKKHIGFYPTPKGMDESIPGLTTYQASKGTLQFPNDQPLPLDLVRQVVKLRVQQNSTVKPKKKEKK